MNKRLESDAPIKLFLAEWRERRGLSQEALAERVGTTKASISRWENGERDMTTKGMSALANALGIEPVQLFRHPDHISLDDLLGSASPILRRKAIAVLNALLAEESGELHLSDANPKQKH